MTSTRQLTCTINDVNNIKTVQDLTLLPTKCTETC